MARTVYERDVDALFVCRLKQDDFATAFLGALDVTGQIKDVAGQVRHTRHSGTIDVELRLTDDSRLLIENKIDAAFSVTLEGDPQPRRYAATVADLANRGVRAQSVLLAPQKYLLACQAAAQFDKQLSYEALRPALIGEDRNLLEAAIAQANEPYEPAPNMASGDFFRDYNAFVRENWPALVIKRNPNGGGIRPTGSRTIYFDVKRTLRFFPGIPTLRMSLQCRDSRAPSASVKIMLGGLGNVADRIEAPDSLRQVGGYLRTAGGSLACVIDTPQLDTQSPIAEQIRSVATGLEAADRLRQWWGTDGGRFSASLERGKG